MTTAVPGASVDALEDLVSSVVAPAALEIDHTGSFPRAAIQALGAAGVLGLLSATEVGGQGGSLRQASHVIERLAGADGSTAMIVLMHFSATAVIEAHGPRDLRESIAAGGNLATLAFSEAGSRSHFWAPLSTAVLDGNQVRLDAQKSWVTSAGEADTYVWSSKPLAAEGPMTLWLVPADRGGLRASGPFDGLGLRGNNSRPVAADGVRVEPTAMLGADGAGLDIALGVVLPTFLVLNASMSLGLMEAVTAEAGKHLIETRLAHLDRALSEQVVTRLDFARMRLETDRTRALLEDTLTALETGRADAMLRVLEVKAAAAESALRVSDLAMKVGGGSAFRKESGIERHFRDALAARVMAPTTDALLDFIGRATLGLPLLDGAIA